MVQVKGFHLVVESPLQSRGAAECWLAPLPPVDPAQSQVVAVQERWQALALSRRHKAVALGVALWILWMNVNWTARAQAMLLGALTVRCNLKPAEVQCLSPNSLANSCFHFTRMFWACVASWFSACTLSFHAHRVLQGDQACFCRYV